MKDEEQVNYTSGQGSKLQLYNLKLSIYKYVMCRDQTKQKKEPKGGKPKRERERRFGASGARATGYLKHRKFQISLHKNHNVQTTSILHENRKFSLKLGFRLSEKWKNKY